MTFNSQILSHIFHLLRNNTKNHQSTDTFIYLELSINRNGKVASVLLLINMARRFPKTAELWEFSESRMEFYDGADGRNGTLIFNGRFQAFVSPSERRRRERRHYATRYFVAMTVMQLDVDVCHLLMGWNNNTLGLLGFTADFTVAMQQQR